MQQTIDMFIDMYVSNMYMWAATHVVCTCVYMYLHCVYKFVSLHTSRIYMYLHVFTLYLQIVVCRITYAFSFTHR
jgi:hypothetical protein